MVILIIAIICSYLLGAVPVGYLLTRMLKGTDIRKFGSGNVGATNVYRGVSPAAGFTVLFLDIAKGLIAVDAKTEHGRNHKGEIVAMDEIWTMDSSRFWLLGDYQEQWKRLKAGEISELNPVSYSKEFARGFSEGDKGYTDEQRALIAVRYIEGIQHLLNRKFEPDMKSRNEQVVYGLQTIVNEMVD